MNVYQVFRNMLAKDGAEGQKWNVLVRFFYAHIRFLKESSFSFRWVNNIRLKAIHHRAGTTECYYYGLFDRMEQTFLLKYLKEDDLFVDVGANIGSYSLLVASRGVRAIAFEPENTTYSILVENAKMNHFSDLIICNQKAVGKENGMVKFSVGNDTTNHILDSKDKDTKALSVEVVTLDSLNEDVTILKVDVEGFELDVLAGAKELLCNPKLNVVIIEALSHEDDIAKTLMQNGFGMYKYDYHTNSLKLAGNHDERGNNYLFIRDIHLARLRIQENM